MSAVASVAKRHDVECVGSRIPLRVVVERSRLFTQSTRLTNSRWQQAELDSFVYELDSSALLCFVSGVLGHFVSSVDFGAFPLRHKGVLRAPFKGMWECLRIIIGDVTVRVKVWAGQVAGRCGT